MIDYATFMRIKFLRDNDKMRISQIAAELQLDRRTVVAMLRRKNYLPRQIGRRASILDPYKDFIKRELTKHDFSATQIFQRLRESGYAGSYGIVRDFVRLVRPRSSPAYLTLSFAPGECAQVDWGEYGTIKVGSTSRKLSFFLMVLCYSRMMYLEFSLRQTSEHFLACHLHAFDFFGGVPQRLMIDNLKSAVIKHLVGEQALLNPLYLDFAHHYGLAISACNVRKGNEKGRVENGVGYVKKNLLRGLEIPDFTTIQSVGRHWLDNIANVRIHGETKKTPISLFAEDKAALRPLPPIAYDIGTIHSLRASSQFRITFETNRYSVPSAFASQRVTVKSYPDRLCIYFQNNLIAHHQRSYDRHQDFEHPDHPRELLCYRKKALQQKVYSRFIAISPRAGDYYLKLQERRLNPLVHMRKIVALTEIYSPAEVARAIDDAFVCDAFSSEYITNILESRARLLPEPGPLQLTRNEDLLELELDEPDFSIYEQFENDNEESS